MSSRAWQVGITLDSIIIVREAVWMSSEGIVLWRLLGVVQHAATTFGRRSVTIHGRRSNLFSILPQDIHRHIIPKIDIICIIYLDLFPSKTKANKEC